MGGAADPLGHLLLRLDLHVHIACARLDGSDEPLFGDLHRLDLTCRVCQALQRRFILRHLSNTACSHQRHIGCEHILGVPRRKFAPVQTDLRHLTMLQSLKNLLYCLVLYRCTNHSSISIIPQPHPLSGRA